MLESHQTSESTLNGSSVALHYWFVDYGWEFRIKWKFCIGDGLDSVFLVSSGYPNCVTSYLKLIPHEYTYTAPYTSTKRQDIVGDDWFYSNYYYYMYATLPSSEEWRKSPQPVTHKHMFRTPALDSRTCTRLYSFIECACFEKCCKLINTKTWFHWNCREFSFTQFFADFSFLFCCFWFKVFLFFKE